MIASISWPQSVLNFFRNRILINLNTVLRQVHRIFQSVFSTVFPLLISSILSLLWGHPVTAYVFSIVRAFTSNLSSTCFRRQFLRKMWPIHLAFFLVIVCRLFLSSLTLCNTSFFTRSIQLIFSVLLQHRISRLSRYLWSTFRSVQVSAERSRIKISLNVK